MTVAVGWVRQGGINCQELIIASDSRLCGGLRWDQCPKILTLPRNDCAICFAGDTVYAYPMMMQVYFASGESEKVIDRAIDIKDFNGHVLNHINQLQESIFARADPDGINENEFIFGGYSWHDKQFRLWRYHFKPSEKRFVKYQSSGNYLGKFENDIIFVGDKKNDLNKKLIEILRNKYGDKLERYNGQGFDMEPLEALIALLKSSRATDTIGGAPQVVKIYQHMNCKPIGVYWPKREEDLSKNRTLLGRKMFHFEKSNYWFLDPDTLRICQNK